MFLLVFIVPADRSMSLNTWCYLLRRIVSVSGAASLLARGRFGVGVVGVGTEFVCIR